LVFHGGRYARVVKQAPSAAATDTFRDGFLGYLLGSAHGRLFEPLHQAFSERGLGEPDFRVLSALGENEQQSLTVLAGLLDSGDGTGIRQIVQRLQARGLLRRDLDDAEDGPVTLTETGRRLMVELLAIAKSAEADVEEHLDHSEMLMLKDLLKRVIASPKAAEGA
jgi:DNA-binding MarR family transcriptional regulator